MKNLLKHQLLKIKFLLVGLCELFKINYWIYNNTILFIYLFFLVISKVTHNYEQTEQTSTKSNTNDRKKSKNKNIIISYIHGLIRSTKPVVIYIS